MYECDPPSLSLGRLAELWRVIRMYECGPPLLSLGRLAELWRVIRMCECDPTTLLTRFAEELRRVGRLKCVKVALRRSVSAGSLSFAGLSERSTARKRSKLWGSDSANDASRVAGGDREGVDIFLDDEAGADVEMGA